MVDKENMRYFCYSNPTFFVGDYCDISKLRHGELDSARITRFSVTEWQTDEKAADKRDNISVALTENIRLNIPLR